MSETVILCAECLYCIEHGPPIDWRCRYLVKNLPDLLRGNSKDMGGVHCVTMRVMEGCCGRNAIWFKSRHNPLKCERCVHRRTGQHARCGPCESVGGNLEFKEKAQP